MEMGIKSDSDGQLFTNQELANLASDTTTSHSFEYNLENFSNELLGYLSTHKLLNVKVLDEKKVITKRLTFFVKSLKTDTNDFERTVFERESRLLNEVAPLLLQNYKSEPWSPKCALVKGDMMVMEDLRSQGFKVVKGRDFGPDHWKSGIETVASFHASSILLEERSKKPLSDMYPGFFEEIVFVNDHGLGWKWLLAGMETAELIARNLNLNPKPIAKAYDLILERIRPSDGKLNVLCHADLWSNNMMFKNDDGEVRCRLVDFQMTAYTCYAVDLAQFMYLNVDRESRGKHEKELIRIYHSKLFQELEKHGYEGRIISFEEVWRDFEEKRICGLVTVAQFFPIALLNDEFSKKYTSDPDKFHYYSYTSRVEFVKMVMKADSSYREKLGQSVSELIEYMKTHFKEE